MWCLAMPPQDAGMTAIFTDAHWAAPFGHEQRVLEAHDVKTLAGEIRTALQAAP